MRKNSRGAQKRRFSRGDGVPGQGKGDFRKLNADTGRELYPGVVPARWPPMVAKVPGVIELRRTCWSRKLETRRFLIRGLGFDWVVRMGWHASVPSTFDPMKNLKTTPLVAAIVFLVGCGVGSLVVQNTAVRREKALVLKQMTTVMAMERLSHAQLLRNGKPNQVLSLIEGTLGDTAKWCSAFGPMGPAEQRLLWQIEDYYTGNKVAVPSEIQTILATLPPRPVVVSTTDGAVGLEPDFPGDASRPARAPR